MLVTEKGIQGFDGLAEHLEIVTKLAPQETENLNIFGGTEARLSDREHYFSQKLLKTDWVETAQSMVIGKDLLSKQDIKNSEDYGISEEEIEEITAVVAPPVVVDQNIKDLKESLDAFQFLFQDFDLKFQRNMQNLNKVIASLHSFADPIFAGTLSGPDFKDLLPIKRHPAKTLGNYDLLDNL